MSAAVRTVHVNRTPIATPIKVQPPPVPVRRIHSLPDRTVCEQSQLDDILNDLLNDPLFVDGSKTFEFSNDGDGTYGIISANCGSITTAHSPRRGRYQASLAGLGIGGGGGGAPVGIGSGGCGGRTVVSWQTNQTGPKQRSVSASRQTPTIEITSTKRVDSERMTTTSSTTRMQNGTSGGWSEQVESRRKEVEANRPPSPPVRRHAVGTTESSQVGMTNGAQRPPHDELRIHRTAWKEEKHRVVGGRNSGRNHALRHPTDIVQSDSEDYFRSSSGPDRAWSKPSFEDPYMSDDMAPYFNQVHPNHQVPSRPATAGHAGTRSGRSSTGPQPGARVFDLESPLHTMKYETKRSFFVSGIERPANTSRQTKYTFSMSPQRSLVDEEPPRPPPPPVPTPPRDQSPAVPPFPVLPPVRSDSSREAVQRVTSSRVESGRRSRSPSLDDLERSILSVQQLLESHRRPPQEAAPVPETPTPKQTVVEVEEEVISLRPIGPGVQNLEPDDPARFRSMTPAFPTQRQTSVESCELSLIPIGPGVQNLEPDDPARFRSMTPAFPTQRQRVVSPYPWTPPGGSQQHPGTGFPMSAQGEVRTLTDLSPQSSVSLSMTSRPVQPAVVVSSSNDDSATIRHNIDDLVAMLDSPQMQTQQPQQQQPRTAAQRPDQLLTPQRAERVLSSPAGTNGFYQQQTVAGYQLNSPMSDSTPTSGDAIYQTPRRAFGNESVTSTLSSPQSIAGYSESIDSQTWLQQKKFQQQQQRNQFVQQQQPTQSVSIQRTQTSSTANGTSSQHPQQQQLGETIIERQITSQQLQSVSSQLTEANGAGIQRQQSQPIVIEDFSVHQSATDYHTPSANQEAAELTLTKDPVQRHLSAGQTSRTSGGDGFLTVTSTTTRSATTAVDRGRSVSPSDMALRARLQSRLETRSPGLIGQAGGATSPSVYLGHSRTSLTSINDGSDVLHQSPRFVRDTSKFWHKPHITREDAISLLRDKPPGSFVVRNSSTFQGAFGLALKVAQLPPNVHSKEGVDPQSELVRHFLIEPTSKGVHLKGCSNEPMFASLAALIYQHTITPLALPCKLVLPEVDIADVDAVDANTTGTLVKTQLYQQGAACHVLYVATVDMESLTGPEALSRAIAKTFSAGSQAAPPSTTVVHFKVSSQGITLTDNKHRLFFRRHYPINTVTFCGVDTKDRRWTLQLDDNQTLDCKVFGFVARKPNSSSDNACHVFAEMDPSQPANAIVNFLTKVMIGQGHFMKT